MVMQGMVLLRSVQRWDKPIALGMCFGIVGILSQGPGHLLYLFISCKFQSIHEVRPAKYNSISSYKFLLN